MLEFHKILKSVKSVENLLDPLYRFCPSVFLYLLSVIPSIWILELEKIDKRVKAKEDNFNLTVTARHNLKDLNDLIGVCTNYINVVSII